MSKRPLLVYLDNSDLSKISDPRHGHEWAAERAALVQYVGQGDIRCVVSQAHLVEMAPFDGVHPELAVRKVDLLVSLSGGLALPSLDRLISSELLALREGRPRSCAVVSHDGRWYPSIDGLLTQADATAATKDVVAEVIAQAGNREQRRAAAKKLLRNGAPSPLLMQRLRSAMPGDGVQDIQKTYPMRDEDADTLARYFLGQVSSSDAQRAFEASLRDPRFMMRWFVSGPEHATKFTSWFRDSSRQLKAAVDQMAALAKQVRSLPAAEQADVAPPALQRKTEWDRQGDAMVARIAQRLADEFLPPATTPLPLPHLHETCAGLCTMLRTFLSAAWASTTKQPREASQSDLGDSFHALYAPYVDIFRPDAFTAPHVKHYASGFGTHVVPSLKQLVASIETRLVERATEFDR